MARRGLLARTQLADKATSLFQDAAIAAVDALADAGNALALPLVVATTSGGITAGQPLVVFTGIAGCKLMLPPAKSVDAGTASFQFIANVSANSVAVVPTGKDTVNGALSLTVNATTVAMLVSDGVSRWTKVA